MSDEGNAGAKEKLQIATAGSKQILRARSPVCGIGCQTGVGLMEREARTSVAWAAGRVLAQAAEDGLLERLRLDKVLLLLLLLLLLLR